VNSQIEKHGIVQLGFGLLLALAYFIAPVFVISILTLGVLFWTTVGYLGACALGLGLASAIPFWFFASRISMIRDSTRFGAVLFLFAGAASAICAFGLLAMTQSLTFAPLEGLGADDSGAVIVLTGYAAVCSMLGWLTIRWNARAPEYEDALGGHTFEELAHLIDDQK